MKSGLLLPRNSLGWLKTANYLSLVSLQLPRTRHCPAEKDPRLWSDQNCNGSRHEIESFCMALMYLEMTFYYRLFQHCIFSFQKKILNGNFYQNINSENVNTMKFYGFAKNWQIFGFCVLPNRSNCCFSITLLE